MATFRLAKSGKNKGHVFPKVETFDTWSYFCYFWLDHTVANFGNKQFWSNEWMKIRNLFIWYSSFLCLHILPNLDIFYFLICDMLPNLVTFSTLTIYFQKWHNVLKMYTRPKLVTFSTLTIYFQKWHVLKMYIRPKLVTFSTRTIYCQKWHNVFKMYVSQNW